MFAACHISAVAACSLNMSWKRQSTWCNCSRNGSCYCPLTCLWILAACFVQHCSIIAGLHYSWFVLHDECEVSPLVDVIAGLSLRSATLLQPVPVSLLQPRRHLKKVHLGPSAYRGQIQCINGWRCHNGEPFPWLGTL